MKGPIGPRVTEVLHAAAQLVERGWVQNRAAAAGPDLGSVDLFDTRAFCFCATAAVSRAASDLKVPGLHEQALRRLTAEVKRRGGKGIVPWNDAPGRIQAEVVDALRVA